MSNKADYVEKDYLSEYLDEYDEICDKNDNDKSNGKYAFHTSSPFAQYDDEDEIEKER